jgi:hypothetical protein
MRNGLALGWRAAFSIRMGEPSMVDQKQTDRTVPCKPNAKSTQSHPSQYKLQPTFTHPPMQKLTPFAAAVSSTKPLLGAWCERLILIS